MGIYQPLLPADIEALAVSFLNPLMGGLQVCTAVPKPSAGQTVPDPFLRVEYGGGQQVNLLEYDIDTILFGYGRDEIDASLNTRKAFAHMVAATGSTVDGWYVGWCRGPSLPHRSNDPKVPEMRRYRAMVTWRVQGQPITTP